jgi:isoleucyl-tRNA synthetase
MRRAGQIGSSLQAVVAFAPGDDAALLSEDQWAEILIVPAVSLDAVQPVLASIAPGDKCARCWKVLPEVGQTAAHPALCLRCAEVVAS